MLCHSEEAAGRRGNPFSFSPSRTAHKGMRIAASLALLAMTDSELRSVLLSPVIPRRPQADVGIRSLFPGPTSHSKGARIAASLRSSQ